MSDCRLYLLSFRKVVLLDSTGYSSVHLIDFLSQLATSVNQRSLEPVNKPGVPQTALLITDCDLPSEWEL